MIEWQRLFFKEGPSPRAWFVATCLTLQYGIPIAYIWIVVHFCRKYW